MLKSMGMQGLIHRAWPKMGAQDALGAWTTYGSDADERWAQRMDARGWVTTYSRDPLSRTVSQVSTDGTLVTNIYDPAGRRGCRT